MSKSMGVRDPWQRQLEGSFEHGNEITVFQKRRKIYWVSQKKSASEKINLFHTLKNFRIGGKNDFNLTGCRPSLSSLWDSFFTHIKVSDVKIKLRAQNSTWAALHWLSSHDTPRPWRLNIYTQFNHTRRIISNFIIICYAYKQRSKLNYSNFRQLTCCQSDDTRCCITTIWPPEDEQDIARNMYMYRILINLLKICASSWSLAKVT
jgi:hypothetical protein